MGYSFYIIYFQGLEATLRCLSLEYPSKRMQVYSREELTEQLGVKILLSENENECYPRPSILEVLLEELIKKDYKINTFSNLNFTKFNVHKNSFTKNLELNRRKKEIDIKYLNETFKNSVADNTETNCKNGCRILKTPQSYLPSNGKKKLQKFQPGFEAIKFFLNTVSKGELR